MPEQYLFKKIDLTGLCQNCKQKETIIAAHFFCIQIFETDLDKTLSKRAHIKDKVGNVIRRTWFPRSYQLNNFYAFVDICTLKHYIFLNDTSSIAHDKGLNEEHLKERTCWRGAYSSWPAFLGSNLAAELHIWAVWGVGNSVINCAFSLEQRNSLEENGPHGVTWSLHCKGVANIIDNYGHHILS